MAQESTLEELIQKLNDKVNWNVRREAAERLGDLKEASVVDALLAVISDDNQIVREEIIVSLGKIADARSLSAIGRALEDPNKSIREKAILHFQILVALGLNC